jgi:hypothetical protein
MASQKILLAQVNWGGYFKGLLVGALIGALIGLTFYFMKKLKKKNGNGDSDMELKRFLVVLSMLPSVVLLTTLLLPFFGFYVTSPRSIVETITGLKFILGEAWLMPFQGIVLGMAYIVAILGAIQVVVTAKPMRGLYPYERYRNFTTKHVCTGWLTAAAVSLVFMIWVLVDAGLSTGCGIRGLAGAGLFVGCTGLQGVALPLLHKVEEEKKMKAGRKAT